MNLWKRSCLDGIRGGKELNRDIRFKIYDILNKRIFSYGQVMHLPMCEVFSGTPEQRAVIPMEFTGETDKDNKEIYEDYIYSIDSPYFKGNAVVIKNGSGFVFKGIEKSVCYSVSILHEYSTQIGNIHENPELLLRLGGSNR